MEADLRLMSTGSGNKLVIVVSQPGDGYVRVRKWRAASRKWTNVQKVSAALVYKPFTEDQVKWFNRAKKSALLVKI